MSARTLLACALGFAAFAFVSPAQAQGLSGAGGVYNVQRRIYYESAVYEQSGLWYGGAGTLRLGPLNLGLSGLMGNLTSNGGAATADVKVRNTVATLHLAVGPWIEIGVQGEARRFEGDAGVTLWKLLGGNARLEPGLGIEGLRGVVDVSMLPASSVSGGPELKTAIQASVGASLRPRSFPLTLQLAYRFERYDIAASGSAPERYEQFRGVVAEVGLHIGR